MARPLTVVLSLFCLVAAHAAAGCAGATGYPRAVRRALRLAGLAVALSLWVIAARASASSPAPSTPGSSPSILASPGIPVLLGWETVGMMPQRIVPEGRPRFRVVRRQRPNSMINIIPKRPRHRRRGLVISVTA